MRDQPQGRCQSTASSVHLPTKTEVNARAAAVFVAILGIDDASASARWTRGLKCSTSGSSPQTALIRFQTVIALCFCRKTTTWYTPPSAFVLVYEAGGSITRWLCVAVSLLLLARWETSLRALLLARTRCVQHGRSQMAPAACQHAHASAIGMRHARHQPANVQLQGGCFTARNGPCVDMLWHLTASSPLCGKVSTAETMLQNEETASFVDLMEGMVVLSAQHPITLPLEVEDTDCCPHLRCTAYVLEM